MRKRTALMVGLIVATGLMPWVDADAARQKIAVLGIETRDEGSATSRQKSAALAKTLTAELRSRVESGGYELAQGAVKDLLELKLISDCLDENPICMAAIGRQLGADLVVYGHLEKRRGAYTVSLFRLETATKVVRSLEAPRVGAATDDAMRRVAAGVPLTAPAEVAPPPDPARLVVLTSAPATVFVNGTARGSTAEGQPLVVNDLAGGGTRLAVEAPGFKRWESSIDVRPHGKTEVTVTLEPAAAGAAPSAPPIVPGAEPRERPGKTARVLFWTSLVATGAGVAAFTITGLQVRSIEDEQSQAIKEWGDGFKSNGIQHPNDACAEARNDGFAKLVDICDRGQNMSTVTNVLIGATAVAAVATAFFYWRGYLATGDGDRERGQSAKLTPIVTPEVYKNGAGLSTVIQF
jgi:hypothetical protein